MAPYMALVALLFIVAGMGAYFLPDILRNWRGLEGGESGPDVLRLQESIDELTARLALLEEEVEFNRELRSTEETPRIEPGKEPEKDAFATEETAAGQIDEGEGAERISEGGEPESLHEESLRVEGLRELLLDPPPEDPE